MIELFEDMTTLIEFLLSLVALAEYPFLIPVVVAMVAFYLQYKNR